MRRLALLALGLTFSTQAHAQSLSVHGMGQARVVVPSNEISWMDGGYGRLRYGVNDDEDAVFKVSDLFLETHFQATSALSMTATIKHDPEQREAVDLVDGYVRYRPVSTSPWRWSAKAGVFFPPVSFENNDIGWTNDYTLTSSAINSWIGEEVRIVGVETGLEWRSMQRTISVSGAVYGWNDPVGVLLAVRGWGFTDRVTSLFDEVRLTDYFAQRIGKTPPYSETEIHEIDNTPGWYANLTWEERNGVRFMLTRFDNRGDPYARDKGQAAWLTEFWSAGAEFPVDHWTFILQGMTGHTDIAFPSAYLDTKFSSVFALVSRDIGDVRLTGRADYFRTDESVNDLYQGREEIGGAFTAAAIWRINENVRLKSEAIFVTSDRPERIGAGLASSVNETQGQIAIDLRF